MPSPDFIRWTGLSGIFAGILIVIGSAIHPPSEELVLNEFWIPAHVLLWLGFIFALLGYVGLYQMQSGKMGRLGSAGFFIIFIGTAMTTGIFFVAATVEPIIAEGAPSLLGVIVKSPVFLLFILSIVILVLGAVLFGIATLRARVLSKVASLLLIIGSLIVLVGFLAVFPEKIIDTGAAIFGIALILFGYYTWNH